MTTQPSTTPVEASASTAAPAAEDDPTVADPQPGVRRFMAVRRTGTPLPPTDQVTKTQVATSRQSCRCRTLDVGVDLDGCCYQFDDALRSYIAQRTGRDIAEFGEPKSWNFFPEWKIATLEEFLSYMVDAVNDEHLFAVGDPYPGVIEGTAALIAAGHRVHIITDRAKLGRPGLGERLTRAWLEQHSVSFTSLTLSPDKTCVPTDVFIEDRPENYLALAESGTDVYLRDQPYNRHMDVPPGRRVHSFTEFVDAILRCDC